MRVLFLSDVYYPRVNGVSTSIRSFRTDLAACGIETLLVAPRYLPDTPAAEPGGVLRIGSSRVPGDPEDRRMHWRGLTRTLDAFGRGRFSLVHVHTPFLAHYAGARYAQRAGIPCIATCHTFFEEYLHHYVPLLPRTVGRALARAVMLAQCRSMNAVIAPTEPMRAALCDYGVDRPVHVVPTGLPPECFVPGDGARFRRTARIPAERPLLLYVGRVAHEKNIEFLLRAFVLVRSRLPAAMLAIAGEGPAREPLQALAGRLGLRDDVRFIGYLDRERSLLDCYAAADVFVFASRTETQGLVLLEAMAQGAPVVALAALGTRAILTRGCGAIAAEDRIEAFADAVLCVLSDASLHERLAAEGRAHAQRWSSRAAAERLAALYRSLAPA